MLRFVATLFLLVLQMVTQYVVSKLDVNALLTVLLSGMIPNVIRRLNVNAVLNANIHVHKENLFSRVLKQPLKPTGLTVVCIQ